MADKEIDTLIDRFTRYVDSDKNQSNRKFWAPEDQVSRDLFSRQTPRELNEIERIPVAAGPLNSLFSKVFSFSLKQLYNDPKSWLRTYLGNYLYRMENIPEDMYFDKELPLYLGPHLPWTLYGVKSFYFDDREPELDQTRPILANTEDLQCLEMPDFHKSGMMPLVHTMYQDVGELLNGRLKLIFPGYNRGPLGIALILRGLENLVIDMKTDPDFVHRLMSFATKSRIKWEKDRAVFLGEGMKKVDLWNDEVAVPTLSPELYREFVLPYEREIDQTTGVGYWHSCGDTTLLAKDIASLEHVIMYHISSWTDLEKAMGDAAHKKIELGLNPQRFIQSADDASMKKKMSDVMAVCKRLRPKAFYILLNGLDVMGDWNDNLVKLRSWYEYTKQIGKL